MGPPATAPGAGRRGPRPTTPCAPGGTPRRRASRRRSPRSRPACRASGARGPSGSAGAAGCGRRLGPGSRATIAYENFSSSCASCASFARRWALVRARRTAKWHQSSAGSGQGASCGQGATVVPPASRSRPRAARTSWYPAGVPGSTTTIAPRVAAQARRSVSGAGGLVELVQDVADRHEVERRLRHSVRQGAAPPGDRHTRRRQRCAEPEHLGLRVDGGRLVERRRCRSCSPRERRPALRPGRGASGERTPAAAGPTRRAWREARHRSREAVSRRRRRRRPRCCDRATPAAHVAVPLGEVAACVRDARRSPAPSRRPGARRGARRSPSAQARGSAETGAPARSSRRSVAVVLLSFDAPRA